MSNDQPKQSQTTAKRRQWRVTEALLESLALLLVEDQAELDKSHFREFIDHNEFALALEQLSEVVNRHG